MLYINKFEMLIVSILVNTIVCMLNNENKEEIHEERDQKG